LLDGSGERTTDSSEVEGFRLLTDAEWEFAARGGNASEGYTRSGGNSVDLVAWYKSNSENMTHPVRTKAQTNWESSICREMFGNGLVTITQTTHLQKKRIHMLTASQLTELREVPAG
jgi:hypothetical protein